MRFYSFLTALFFIYQAAFGGLFFLASKEFSSAHHYHLLLSLFISAEPIIMILAGVWISKSIDKIRDNYRKRNFYYILSAMTALSFIGFYIFIDKKNALIPALGFYFLATTFFVMERIYRQRFPRDYAQAHHIPLHRVNSVNNLVNRGTAIVSPLVLLLFAQGLSLTYITILVFFSFSSSFAFAKGMKMVHHASSIKKEAPQHEDSNTSKAWGQWHVLHLATMNFAFGALFFLLSQAVITSTSIQAYLQSPVPLYIGFVGAMLFIAFGFKKSPSHLSQGIALIIPMSLCLIGSAYAHPLIAGCLLLIFGIFFAFSINMITSEVQHHLSHQRYSYYETRAQVFGRISSLVAISSSGALLDLGISLHHLEGLFGILGLVGYFILRYGSRKLIQ